MQIWIAVIAYLLLFWLNCISKVDWGFLEYHRLAQIRLLERCDLLGLQSQRLIV